MRRRAMRSNYLKAPLKTVSLGIIIVLFITAASAQVTVNLTASRQSALLPDGNTVPMWGWTCDATSTTAKTCLTLAGAPQMGGAVWQPPLITVPTGMGLTITLTNKLPIATSLTIVGQLGGGLGTPQRETGARTDGAHGGQTTTTWPIQGGSTFTPPSQANRARSFGLEVAANSGTPAKYTWGLPGQPPLKPGTYLIETGTYPSIQGPMGLYGVLVVTTAPATYARIAYLVSSLTTAPSTQPHYSIHYDADVPLLLSEIDPVQNAAADTAVQTTGFSETAKWTPACGAAGSNTCYPAAVNFTPLYFLVNGLSFDKRASFSSAVGIPASASTGNVLLRFVNAGLRMHVPSVGGLPMSLIAEDGNVLSDIALQAAHDGTTSFNYNARTQSEVFLPAGKVYDVVVNPANSGGTYTASQFAVFDRQLSLSGNGFRHDTGMQSIVLVNGGLTGNGAVSGAILPHAVADNYIVPAGATSFTGNVLSNDIGISNAANATGCALSTAPQTITTAHGSVVLNPNGSFTYPPTAPLGSGVTDSFSYCGNGNSSPATTAQVTFNAATVGLNPQASADTYTSHVSSLLKVNSPGVLTNDTDPTGYLLTVKVPSVVAQSGLSVIVNPDGGFTATQTANAGGTFTFCYQAVNSQGTPSAPTTAADACTLPNSVGLTQVTLNFQAGSGLSVKVQDAQNPATQIADYKWIIEQDLTFHVDPACQQNGTGGTKPATCPTGVVPTLGTNFQTSYMPVVAEGCTGPQSCERGQMVYNPATGSHDKVACDGSGICHPDPTGNGLPQSMPGQVNLPATDAYGRPAYYYLSILPGDVANPFNTGNTSDPSKAGNCAAKPTATRVTVPSCGHTMGGAPIAPGQTAVTVNVELNPLTTAPLPVFVFEDDFPLNGEPDTGGGVDTLASQEVALGDFQVELWDAAGGSGDATGQMTYDMFNEPLTNSLNGTIDPSSGLNACPISQTDQGSTVAIGVIIVCPKFESDGVTLSPLTGQAVIKGLMPGRFGVIVHPGAAREARGEQWLQTNSLDGTHFLDSFLRSGGPAYFQEFGPGGCHVFMGMANPAIINARLAALCGGANPPACNNTVKGQVSNLHQSRSTNETLYDSTA